MAEAGECHDTGGQGAVLMAEYKRYNLTLTKAPPQERTLFRSLSRPDSYSEIRPGAVGDRVAYSVEMTEEEYERALNVAQDPGANLIAVEPVMQLYEHATVPGSTALAYMAAEEANSLGLTGQGVDVGIVEQLGYGYIGGGSILTDVFSGRVKAAKGFGYSGPRQNRVPIDVYNNRGTGHASKMSSIAIPPNSRIVAAAYGGGQTFPEGAVYDTANDSNFAAAVYWMVDEIGVDIINMSQGLPDEPLVLVDAMKHARSKGVILFASAGNGGEDFSGAGEQVIAYPAKDSAVNAITNYRPSTDRIASSSNYGSGVWAATAGSELYQNVDGAVVYADDGGTSAAAAMATNIAARLMSGGNSPGNVESYLASTARKTGASPIYEGAGVLQLAAASNELQYDEPEKTDLKGDPITGPEGEPKDGTGTGGTGGDEAGACDEGEGEDETTEPVLYVLTSEIPAAVHDCLIEGGWSMRSGDGESRLYPASTNPSGYFPGGGHYLKGDEPCIVILKGANWIQSGNQLARLRPPASWWHEE